MALRCVLALAHVDSLTWIAESSNQDYALMQGHEAVDLIRSGGSVTESTYWPARTDAVVVPPRPSTPITLSLPVPAPVETVLTSPRLAVASA